jgi:hypothetical protein
MQCRINEVSLYRRIYADLPGMGRSTVPIGEQTGDAPDHDVVPRSRSSTAPVTRSCTSGPNCSPRCSVTGSIELDNSRRDRPR